MIEAMKQALDALEGMASDLGKFENEVPAIASVRQAIAEAEKQEPVAVVTGVYGGRFVVEPTNSAMVLPVNMALYTHPQPRKPLTDEQKKSISRRAFKDICKDYPVQDRIIRVIEDIEAAHGIKE